MLKLSENPAILHPPVGSVRELVGTWWLAHTKARAEKAFAWDLSARGIGYFLPMQQRVRIVSGKKRRPIMPLFPGYVFLCGGEQDRYAAMTTNRLCQTIAVADQAKLIDELAAVEQALRGGIELDLYPRAAVGQLCRITAGALAGIEGVVIERGRHARFVLRIDALCQGALMEIDADLLEPLGESPDARRRLHRP
jgi:hypothetical protein